MKFSLNWLNKYTALPVGNKEKLIELIDRIALQIVDVDERWIDDKDAVIDVDNKIITNRPYCFGHRGLAREISVMLNQEYTGSKYPELPNSNSHELNVKVDVQDPDLCPRFTALAIKNVKVGPSPEELRIAVESVGMRSINNIVDITNLIMMDTAQPVHAYDYSKIKNGHIIVRRADDGEKVTTLDGIERTLNSNNLLITDEEKPVGIAGVMGAGNSEIDDNTKDILLEVASFTPINVRQTAKFLKHRTDALTRFEKGIDPTNIPNVMAYMVDLVLQYCGGEIASDYIDINNLSQASVRVEPIKMNFNPLRVDKLLGFNITTDFIQQVFKGFDIKYSIINDNNWELEIPTYRPDIKEPADLVEDIGRMFGYQNIPYKIPVNQLVIPKRNKSFVVKSKIRNILTSLGFDETITFSFISQRDIDNFGYEKIEKIVNPLSEEYVYLRPSLVPSLTKVATLNAKHTNDFGIFEISRKFLPKDINALAYEIDHGESMQPLEEECVTLLAYTKKNDKETINKLKQSVENLFQILHVSRNQYTIAVEGTIALEGKKIGEISFLDNEVKDKYDLSGNVFFAEINLKEIIESYSENIKFKSYSKYQGTTLEYSLFVPESMGNSEIVNVLKSDLMRTFEVRTAIIDSNFKLPEGKKNALVKIYLQKPDGNINDNERYLNGLQIEESLKKLDGIEIRGGGVSKPKDFVEKKVEEKYILAAEILSIDKHPDADRLVVTLVNAGDAKYQIVTGADNINIGDIVPVALPGTAVPGLKNEDGSLVVMKVAKLRGIESYGMMLADDELGIGSDHSGIRILDKEKYKIGDKINPEDLIK